MCENYIINAQHRNRNPNKSQWVISELKENELFNTACISEWIEGAAKKGFGVQKNGTHLDVLGICKDRITDLKIAKFVADHNDDWHGYPANYRKHKQDTPTTNILHKWLDEQLITKSQMCKIVRGQKCKL